MERIATRARRAYEARIGDLAVAASKPIDPKRSHRWPVALDCETVMVAARCERVEQTLRRGRASLQAIVAMTGLDWYLAQQTLDDLVKSDRVATVALGRDYVYELVGGGRTASPSTGSTPGTRGS